MRIDEWYLTAISPKGARARGQPSNVDECVQRCLSPSRGVTPIANGYVAGHVAATNRSVAVDDETLDRLASDLSDQVEVLVDVQHRQIRKFTRRR
jgi:hypothetical protein